MKRPFFGWLLILSLLVPLGAGAETHSFPQPAGLEPAVRFWTRVYTEVGTDAGFLHDSRNLAVVYETLRFPEKASHRTRERIKRKQRDHYKKILRKLAGGARSGLNQEERRVLGLFPDGVTNQTLRNASRQVRFQLGQANKFRDGLVRMGRWEDYIKSVLKERGLPEGLVAIPHVESSYNPNARSHVGASGLWQFTRSTGRLFMRVDHVIDERNDPWLATVAAARLLKQNYEKTGTWPLAITSYNHGAGGMKRAVRQLGTRDMAVIVEKYKSRTFGFASRNFYTSFLAALHVELNPERYFGPIQADAPRRPEIVVLDHFYAPKTLASAFGVSVDSLKDANLALQKPVWNGQKHIPKGYALRVPRDPLRAAPKVVLASIAGNERYTKQRPDRKYRVRSGDTLGKIARRYGVRESELVALNGLRSRHRIRVGQMLRLPVHGKGATPAASSSARAPEPVPADGVYRVRRGDTISAIARRFGVSQGDLVAVNHLKSKNRLSVGQVLQIPGGARSAKVAGGHTEPGVYVVRRGDTLDSIAKRFGTTQRAIASLNGIRNRHRIKAGQRLYIPRS